VNAGRTTGSDSDSEAELLAGLRETPTYRDSVHLTLLHLLRIQMAVALISKMRKSLMITMMMMDVTGSLCECVLPIQPLLNLLDSICLGPYDSESLGGFFSTAWVN
jgi:hypothetical protein